MLNFKNRCSNAEGRQIPAFAGMTWCAGKRKENGAANSSISNSIITLRPRRFLQLFFCMWRRHSHESGNLFACLAALVFYTYDPAEAGEEGTAGKMDIFQFSALKLSQK